MNEQVNIIEKAEAAALVLSTAAAQAAQTLSTAAEQAINKIQTESTQQHSDKLERLTRIETIVTNLQTRLLGNGQPGELQKLDDRMRILEDGRSRVLGVLAAVSFVVVVLGGLETLRLLKVL
jgi:hypothetical protein